MGEGGFPKSAVTKGDGAEFANQFVITRSFGEKQIRFQVILSERPGRHGRCKEDFGHMIDHAVNNGQPKPKVEK